MEKVYHAKSIVLEYTEKLEINCIITTITWVALMAERTVSNKSVTRGIGTNQGVLCETRKSRRWYQSSPNPQTEKTRVVSSL